MPTPITVSVNLIDLTGNTSQGYMVAALASPVGSIDLYVAGTGMLAPKITTSATGSSVSVSVWGNDVVTDLLSGAKNTYYDVAIYNTLNQLVFQASYLFTGIGAVNLLTAPPLSTIPAPVGPIPTNVLTSNNIFTGTNTFSGAVTFNNTVSITGPMTFGNSVAISGTLTETSSTTLNNAAGAGANDLFLGIMDRIRFNCANGSGYRFPTIESTLSDIQTNATQGGMVFTCPDNTTDSPAAQVDIGSTSKTAVVRLHPGNNWSYNNSTSQTYGWGIHNASGIIGEVPGSQGGSRTGGAYLHYGCLSNTTYGIDTADGHSGGGTAFARLSNISLEGCPTGTVGAGSPSIAMLNWEGISETNILENVLVFNFANTIGCRIASNANSGNAVVGPLVLNNLWCDGGYNAGSRPIVISGNSSGVLPIFDVGGVANHPGSGLAAYEINGNGAGGAIFGGHIMKYWENQLNGNSIMMKLVDTNNFTIEGAMTVQSTDTGVDISQSGAGRTCNVFVQALRVSNSTVNAINNHISGATLHGQNYVTFYHYGGDSSCSFHPFTIDSNRVQILNTTGSAHLVKNNLDSELDTDVDSGLTAAQNAYIRFLDRGTAQWLVGKASNILRVTDAVNNHVHLAGIQNGETDLNAYGSSGIQFNVNANSTGGVNFFSGGASPTLKLSVATNGHINQGATGTMAGVCTMSAGTSCTFSIGAAYNSSPICVATQQSATLTGGAVGCTVSGTTVTITAETANSEQWGAVLIGNPN